MHHIVDESWTDSTGSRLASQPRARCAVPVALRALSLETL